jgi:hypothetical protein
MTCLGNIMLITGLLGKFTLKSETIKDANYVCTNSCEIVNHSAVQETIINS